MKYKIVSDSSSNLKAYDKVAFASVPLHIIVGDQEFTDDENFDMDAMQAALAAYKGPTSTSCPSPEDWMRAFGDAEAVYCVTITSKLSGSCSSAHAAKQMYEEKHPERKVFVIDSLSTGPNMELLVDKLADLILKETDPQEIYDETMAYLQKTKLFFSLASVNNLARNGRVNPLVALGIGALGIRIVGLAYEGTLKPLSKGRGDKKALQLLLQYMEEYEYNGGRVLLSHTGNEAGAKQLADMIREKYGVTPEQIRPDTALCGYYAEPGSVLISFETK